MAVHNQYAIEIDRAEYELIVPSVVLAIDYLKRTERSAASGST